MGLKKSDVTRMSIREFLEGYGQKDEEKPFSKVQHLIGIAESGIPDLGQHHREHLVNKIRTARE